MTHKNKTFTTLLAALSGALGLHRFYLRGGRDAGAWLHLSSLAACALIALLAPQANWFYKLLPLLVSALAGFLAALVTGLTADEQWDAAHNADSGQQSSSHWPLALLLVATLMVGASVLIATISRLFDLLLTGGAYG